MKAAPILFLAVLALPAAKAQLAVTRVHDVARHPYQLIEMAVEDMDGDGDSDLLLQGNYNCLTVWCENNGNGSFADPVAINMEPRAFNGGLPFRADLEGDGRRDLYLGDGESRTLNLGGGNFGTPQPIPGGTWPSRNPDGSMAEYKPFDVYALTFRRTGINKDSLIVAERDEEEWNLGPLSFYSIDAQGVPSLVPLMAGGVEIGGSFEGDLREVSAILDLENDGDLDLIFDGEQTLIYRNRGDDTFDAATVLPPPEPAGMASTMTNPSLVKISGQALPSLARLEYHYVPPEDPVAIEYRLVIRPQLDTGGGPQFQAGTALDHIVFPEKVYLEAFVVVPGVTAEDSDEIWVRTLGYNSAEGPYVPARLMGFRHNVVGGWQKHADLTMPARGFGELFQMTPVPGGPAGIACRLGGYGGVNGDSEEKVVWASLTSLRAETPEWKTLAGPFTEFIRFQTADLDVDGSLDLVTGEHGHGLSGPKGGRVHVFYDIATERKHQVLDIETTDWFGGAAVIPGNLFSIGDADDDLLPDLAVSTGPADAIRLLRNLGDRNFSAPETIITSSSILRPLRLGPGTHLYQQGGEVFSKAPQAATPIWQYDLGTSATILRCDMDGDGDQDVVSAPCPLGSITGWGKVDTNGSIVSWHSLANTLAEEILRPGAATEMGWYITSGQTLKLERVREGGTGVISVSLPGPFPSLPQSFPGYTLWPPVDLDKDGDLDLLSLTLGPEEGFGIQEFGHLRWHENRGNHWSFHPERLFRGWSSAANPYGIFVQVMEQAGDRRILLGNGQGEVFQLDFAAPVPGGGFGAWLASFGLSGASAGAESDADGDGLTNLEEALQGTSPIAPTEGNFRIPVSLDSSGGWSFTSAIALAGTGVKVVAEASDDLDEWTVLPDGVELNGESAGRFLYQVPDEDIAAEERRFVRFKFVWTQD